MRESIDQVISIARAMWAFRWQAVAVAWVVALAGWAAVYLLVTPTYTASAQIYADTATLLRPLMRDLAVEVDFSGQVNLMARKVMSRPVLESVVAQTGLERLSEGEGSMATVVDQLHRDLSLTAEMPRNRDESGPINIFDLTYIDRDPAVAKQVVESLIAVFTESTLAEIRQESERASLFIAEQIREQAEVVEAAAEELRGFRQRNQDVLLGEGQSVFDRLQAAQGAIADVETEIDEALARRRSLQRELDGTPAYVRAADLDGNLVPTPLEERLTGLEEELAQLLLMYTDAHPDVIATKDSIARVEAAIRSGSNPAPMARNETHQQLELRVREVASDLAALEVRQEAALRLRDALVKKISTLPAIEDELAGLNRDVATAKEHLSALEERRQSMEISSDFDQNSLSLYFRVIEPPRVPVSAVNAEVWRNKVLLSGAVLLAAVAAGAALAFALFTLRSPVLGQRAVHELTGLPLFGIVARVSAPAARIRDRLGLAAWVLLVGLLVVPFGVNLRLQNESVFADASAELDRLEVVGATKVAEDSIAEYEAFAFHTDGRRVLVEPDSWVVDCEEVASITATGLFSSGEVSADTPCTVSVFYAQGDVTVADELEILVYDDAASSSAPELEALTLSFNGPSGSAGVDLISSYTLSGAATAAATAWYRNGKPLMALYLPFEGGRASAALDYSGNSTEGLVGTGAQWWPHGGYDGNGAYRFDGSTTAAIDLGAGMPVGAYTKTAWVRRSGSGRNNILSGQDGHRLWAPDLYSYRLSAGHARDWDAVQDSEPLEVGRWHFVAVTYDPDSDCGDPGDDCGEMILYKDGAEVDRAINVAPPSQDERVWVGAYAGTYNWTGMIDDVRLYSRALTGEQIAALYSDGQARLVSAETQVGEAWQVHVTPFSLKEAGTTYVSNTLGIEVAAAELDRLEIVGPASVAENGIAEYEAIAYYTDGSKVVVGAGGWSVDCPKVASISAMGQLSSGEVSVDTLCTVSVSYADGGEKLGDVLEVRILDAGALGGREWNDQQRGR